MANEKKLCLKVFVDNEKKRALFGEASTDFIDIIFSFLTLPLSTIVQLFSKNSSLHSIDNLYGCIEKLDEKHWWNKSCKNMILNPHSVAEDYCKDLKLHIDVYPNTRETYFCNMDCCQRHSKYHYSYVKDTICHYCGYVMDKVNLVKIQKKIEEDGFVRKNRVKFIITDNFLIKPHSVSHYIDILKEFGIEDLSLLEERTLEFGRKELLNLLKQLLEGNEVLTKICFPDLCFQSTTAKMKKKNIKSLGNAQLEKEKLQIILVVNKSNNKVVCAELRDEFANQLFSFLTFPLGLVLKFISCSNSFRCIVNLYNSIEELNIKYFKSAERKNMLISPQLPHFFGYNKQLLYNTEKPPEDIEPIHDCLICKSLRKEKRDMKMCEHGAKQFHFEEIDPKFVEKDQNIDQGFVREAQTFWITDDFNITPLSVFSLDQILKKHGLKVGHVEKREITLGRAEVSVLLEAMLFSKTTLNDALLPSMKEVGDMN